MHHIQSHILRILLRQEYARFRDMRPPRVDTNAYSYHLKALQKDDYIVKTDKGYTLSAKGLGYVDGLSSDERNVRKQPKNIAIFALHNSANEWLVVERLIQPYIGQYMMPSGKQHYGESPEDHIRREIYEQLKAHVDVEYCGYTDVRIWRDQQVITHINGHVYTGEYNGPLPGQSDKFRYMFMSLDHPNMVPRTSELILAVLHDTRPFFRSFDAIANSSVISDTIEVDETLQSPRN